MLSLGAFEFKRRVMRMTGEGIDAETKKQNVFTSCFGKTGSVIKLPFHRSCLKNIIVFIVRQGGNNYENAMGLSFRIAFSKAPRAGLESGADLMDMTL